MIVLKWAYQTIVLGYLHYLTLSPENLLHVTSRKHRKDIGSHMPLDQLEKLHLISTVLSQINIHTIDHDKTTLILESIYRQ